MEFSLKLLEQSIKFKQNQLIDAEEECKRTQALHEKAVSWHSTLIKDLKAMNAEHAKLLDIIYREQESGW